MAFLGRHRLVLEIAIVLLVAIVVRLIYLNDLGSAPFYHYPIGDSKIYHERALDIAGGDLVGREAYFHSSPLYPYFMAAIYRIAGPSITAVRVVQILIGSLNCVLILLLTRGMTGKRRGPPLVAGLMAAVYGTFVFFDADLLMIPLVLCFGCASVLLLARGAGALRLLTAGLLLGLAALGKPNVLLFAPVALLWIFTEFQRTIQWKRWLPAALFTAGVVVAVLPISIRNYIVSQDLVLVSSNAGVNLYIGNHEGTDGVFRL
ncbi:MAG: glycosyltransferase family 39 protein, partial [bacterium]|nr:glycosyltransferase family 39 protein [bacterium]